MNRRFQLRECAQEMTEYSNLEAPTDDQTISACWQVPSWLEATMRGPEPLKAAEALAGQILNHYGSLSADLGL